MQDLFLRACRREAVERMPVWYMRQAGRYQPEYRRIRERHTLLDICRNPALCAEVTRLPVEQLGVDAAILFSDIMVPVGAMGASFEIREGVGPVVAQPIRTAADVAQLRPLDPDRDVPYVLEAVERLASTLEVPLIGFAGAPFTLASYLVEGRPSRDYLQVKRLMWADPEAWRALMEVLSDMVVTYLTAQVRAGCSAVQVFDSWVGALSVIDYDQYVFPYMQYIFSRLRPLNVPLIYFGVTTGELLPRMAETGATVIGLDWRVRIRDARARTGDRTALQGNLDPALLVAPWSQVEAHARRIIEEGSEAPGFIFNLGHGVIPEADPETLKRLTAFVHDYSEHYLASRRRGVQQ
ncbi:MAG: uroporphyrinogen decarboxylase [Thermoflavifilum sp.]|nr:uroporphyrinogen decarboxylase [Thermoflavifilum sp.]MCL6512855.1 uroporphyrinogen decarboxylase [Alicyclobacillus sp.]